MTRESQNFRYIEVKPDFKRLSPSADIDDHLNVLQKKLEALIQRELAPPNTDTLEEILAERLPIIHHELDQKNGQFFSLTVLCNVQERISLHDYILDLIRYHLIPGKNQQPASFQHLTINALGKHDKSLYFAHLIVLIKNERDYDIIESNLPYVLQGLKRGIINPQYAQSILNRQIHVPDQKGNHIHDNLMRVIKKWPAFAELLLSEASVFMSMTSNVFRQHRPSKRLTRIICSLALMRKKAHESYALSNTRARIHISLMPMTLQFTFGEKRTLGVCIGISYLNTYQLFNEGCILQAVQMHYPEMQTVKASFITYQHPENASHIAYVELEKKKGEAFTLQEMTYLKQLLPQSLEASIEDVVPSIFMVSNEEEIMKNIIILRDELQSIDDISQVMISFESQTLSHLTFVVTLVRILEQSNFPIHEKFSNLENGWEYIPERTKIVSLEHEEVTKEAHVFRLRCKKSAAFIRTDSSINLHHARQHVIDFLKEKIGPVRDFMGSLIYLQNSLFRQFKEKYLTVAHRHPNLLEDFFYTITPADLQITLPFAVIENLFDHLMEIIEMPHAATEKYVIKKSESDGFAFAMLKLNAFAAEKIDQKMRVDVSLQYALISNKFQFQEHTYLGFIYRAEDEYKRSAFFQKLRSSVLSTIQEEQGTQVLKLGADIYPTSLDPRKTLFPQTYYMFKLLFDGLMRIDSQGKPACAAAESYSLSSDRMTYTFHLRKSFWNNGDPVEAYDFVHAWKKVLSPSFDAPFSFLFYPIKNAKAAKQGEVPLDHVGVLAKDAQTLVVELDYPVSHFLHLLTLNVFFPVNRHVDCLHPDWPFQTQKEYICNGPFMLDEVASEKELQLIKNQNYWDLEHVHLSRVDIQYGDSETLLQKFTHRDIDWLGAPLLPWENRFSELQKSKQSMQSSALSWISVNTVSGPLSNKKLRQALQCALNLNELVLELPIDAQAAYSVLPEAYSCISPRKMQGDPEKARQLFKEALEEMHMTQKEFSKISIIHTHEKMELRDKMLIKMQEQMKEVLGIDLQIETMPWHIAYKRVLQGNFQLFVLSWYFLCDSPLYLFDMYESSDHKKLYPWSSEHYSDILQKAKQEKDSDKLKEKIAELERILLDEVPLIPLYYEGEHFMKNDRLKGFTNGKKVSGIDFKSAYLKSIKSDIEGLVRWM